MKRWLLTFPLLRLLCPNAIAQHSSKHSKTPLREKPIARIASMGSIHYLVSTRTAAAQKFFNQGLAYVYAFTHGPAIQSVQREFNTEWASADTQLRIEDLQW